MTSTIFKNVIVLICVPTAYQFIHLYAHAKKGTRTAPSLFCIPNDVPMLDVSNVSPQFFSNSWVHFTRCKLVAFGGCRFQSIGWEASAFWGTDSATTSAFLVGCHVWGLKSAQYTFGGLSSTTTWEYICIYISLSCNQSSHVVVPILISDLSC